MKFIRIIGGVRLKPKAKSSFRQKCRSLKQLSWHRDSDLVKGSI